MSALGEVRSFMGLGMKQPSAREQFTTLLGNLLYERKPSLDGFESEQLYRLLDEVERAAAYKAMMRCARMLKAQAHSSDDLYFEMAQMIYSEARALKAKGKR